MSLRICEYVAINDKKRLRKYLKTNKVKIRAFLIALACNGENLLQFAATSNALDVGEYLIGKLPVKTVKENLAAVTRKFCSSWQKLQTIASSKVK